jgi:hypothetical protein
MTTRSDSSKLRGMEALEADDRERALRLDPAEKLAL